MAPDVPLEPSEHPVHRDVAERATNIIGEVVVPWIVRARGIQLQALRGRKKSELAAEMPELMQEADSDPQEQYRQRRYHAENLMFTAIHSCERSCVEMRAKFSGYSEDSRDLIDESAAMKYATGVSDALMAFVTRKIAAHADLLLDLGAPFVETEPQFRREADRLLEYCCLVAMHSMKACGLIDDDPLTESQPEPAAGSSPAESQPSPPTDSSTVEPQSPSSLGPDEAMPEGAAQTVPSPPIEPRTANDDVMQESEARIIRSARFLFLGGRKSWSEDMMADCISPELVQRYPDALHDPDYDLPITDRNREQAVLAYSEYCEACANAGKPNSRGLFGEFGLKCFDILASGYLSWVNDRKSAQMVLWHLGEAKENYGKILELIGFEGALLRVEGRFRYWESCVLKQLRERERANTAPAPAESQPEPAGGNGADEVEPELAAGKSRRYPRRAAWFVEKKRALGLIEHAIYCPKDEHGNELGERGPDPKTQKKIRGGEWVSDPVLANIARVFGVNPKDIPDD
jgi:hypothetical protein